MRSEEPAVTMEETKGWTRLVGCRRRPYSEAWGYFHLAPARPVTRRVPGHPAGCAGSWGPRPGLAREHPGAADPARSAWRGAGGERRLAARHPPPLAPSRPPRATGRALEQRWARWPCGAAQGAGAGAARGGRGARRARPGAQAAGAAGGGARGGPGAPGAAGREGAGHSAAAGSEPARGRLGPGLPRCTPTQDEPVGEPRTAANMEGPSVGFGRPTLPTPPAVFHVWPAAERRLSLTWERDLSPLTPLPN